MTESAPRRRRTEAETVEAMFDTALGVVEREGLSLGVHGLSFENIIEEAGVARSAVYRRWNNRDDFFADFLVELLRRDEQVFHSLPLITFGAMEPVLAGFEAAGAPAERSRAAVIELCRVGAATNEESVRSSDGYRRHIALIAVIQASSDPFRSEALEVLRQSEERLMAGLCDYFAGLLERLGMRLRPGVTVARYAGLASATMEGLALHSASLSREPAITFEADPFGVGVQEWTTAGLGLAGLTLSLVEPAD